MVCYNNYETPLLASNLPKKSLVKLLHSITKALNFIENQFAIIEKEGHSFQCQVVKEDSNNEDVLPVESYPLQDIGIDYLLVIPFDKIPGAVLIVSYTKITYIRHDLVQSFPITGQQRHFTCWTPLAVPTRFILDDDNGDICIMSIEFNGDRVIDIKVFKL